MKTRRRVEERKISGRPRKFAEPSRPVTLTLPESTLSDLQQISPDRSRAIVELTRSVLGSDGARKPSVEIVEMAENTGLVVVGPSEALRSIPFLRLIEVAPARYLVALDPGHDYNSLEIAITDTLEDKQYEKREHELLTQLVHHIKRLRRSRQVSMAKILVAKLR